MFLLCLNLCLFVAEFALKKTLVFESISVESFTFGNDQYVVYAQPFSGKCSFLEWDHVNMEFRAYDTIESEHHTSHLLLPRVQCCSGPTAPAHASIAKPQKGVTNVHLNLETD